MMMEVKDESTKKMRKGMESVNMKPHNHDNVSTNSNSERAGVRVMEE
jgi:Rad4 transglutaminase-like domain